MCCGPSARPFRDPAGESRFGFTVGDRIEVMKDFHFKGWHGHVLKFNDKLVAVDLDEPPSNYFTNGQWFLPDDLRKAPLNIIINDMGCYHLQFLTQHKPLVWHQLALKDSGAG